MAEETEPTEVEMRNLAPLVPKPGDRCTDALFRYLKRQFEIFDFLFFVIHLAKHADKSRFAAAEALAKLGSEEHMERFKRVQEDKEPTFDKLKSFAEYQSENMLIRFADNFLCYLSEITQMCILKRPELLRSNEQVKLDDVLKFSSYKELVSFLTDRKINELSYGGIRDIADYFLQRLGLALTESEDQSTRLSVAIELRNISTHNRGVVNDLFLRRLASVPHGLIFTRGKRFHAGYDELTLLANNMCMIAKRLDDLCSVKFRLQRKAYKTWKSPNKGGSRRSAASSPLKQRA